MEKLGGNILDLWREVDQEEEEHKLSTTRNFVPISGGMG